MSQLFISSPNKRTLFYTVQPIFAWQHSVNKAIPYQTVNFFPFAHHLWILPEKQQTTISGYWPRQAPQGSLTISGSCQCEMQLQNEKSIRSLGAISKQSKVHRVLLWSLWAGGRSLITWYEVELFWNVRTKEEFGGFVFCVVVLSSWVMCNVMRRQQSLIVLALIFICTFILACCCDFCWLMVMKVPVRLIRTH